MFLFSTYFLKKELLIYSRWFGKLLNPLIHKLFKKKTEKINRLIRKIIFPNLLTTVKFSTHYTKSVKFYLRTLLKKIDS